MNHITTDAYEGDIVSRLRNWRGLHFAHGGDLFEEAADEIDRLREAIRRLAEQDATLSVQGGNVIVEMDSTREMPMPSDPFCVESVPHRGRIVGIEGIASLRLTDAEREAVEQAAEHAHQDALHGVAATLRGLLERTK